MQQQEEAKASNFRNLYQQVADLILPRENQITGQRTPGEDKSLLIRDPTALMDLDDMVSGFVNVLAGNLRGLLTALNAIKEQKS